MPQLSRFFYLIPLTLVVAGLVLSVRDTEPPGQTVGTLEDVAALSKRTDLNILFLMVDTLRADRLSSYGHRRPTSPTIDELAESGVRFSNHLAQSSWTKASMASLWTGAYPIRTGVLRFDAALPEASKMPAEILRDRGFQTAGIWRNGWVAPNFGFAQGFDLYHKPSYGTVKTAHRRNTPTSKLAGSDQDITASALEFLRVNGHRPWFLYLHYMDVHQYLSDDASALFGTSYSDIYDNSIHWVDRQIRILVDALEAAGLRDNTIIVLASDHGEAFGEHRREGHAKDLYGEVTETPLILSLPFPLQSGIVFDGPSMNVDIWPTVLDLIGAEPLAETDGRSLMPDILSGDRVRSETEEPRASYAHLDGTWGQKDHAARWIVSTTVYPYRLIHHVEGESPNELFDLDRDPNELTNILASKPEISDRMLKRIEEYLEKPVASWAMEPTTVELDDMMIGQLRAIGYAIE